MKSLLHSNNLESGEPISNTITTSTTVYRYKLSLDIQNSMRKFADIHNLDDLETFKREFDVWFQNQHVNIIVEQHRLQKLGYDGDLKKKVFKSIRYYYANKCRIDKQSVSNTEKKTQRAKIFIVPKSIFEYMDRIIENNSQVKPSILFQHFLDVYQNDDNIRALMDEHESILKKSFKNRLFRAKSKC